MSPGTATPYTECSHRDVAPYDKYRSAIRQWLAEYEHLLVPSDDPQSATASVYETATDIVDMYSHHPSALGLGGEVMVLQLGDTGEVDVNETGRLRYTIANPSPAMVARKLSALLEELDVLTIGVREDAGRFRVTIVIEEADMDLWEHIFSRTAEIYDILPDLRAEVIVVDRQDPEGQAVLTGDGVDYAVVP